MLTDKYLAGFLDADGSIEVMWRKADRAGTRYTPHVCLTFTQTASRDEVLVRIQQTFGGELRYFEDKGTASVRIFGKKAERLLDRVKKHLVLKRAYAEAVLARARVPVEDRDQAQRELKEARRRRSSPLPKHPARKWMAGYIDGDGCIYCRCLRRKNGAAQITLEVAAAEYDSEGVELLQSAFGGSISHFMGRQPCVKWVLSLQPSKATKVLGFFAKHAILKKDQADFILGCARMGHFRDGSSIHEAMKHLKARPHRLSEPGADIRSLLEGVRDIRTKRELDREAFEANGGCVDCGAETYHCDGLCRRCYDRRRHANAA